MMEENRKDKERWRQENKKSRQFRTLFSKFNCIVQNRHGCNK